MMRSGCLLALALASTPLGGSAGRPGGYGRQAPVRADHDAVEALIEDIVQNMTVAEKARELDTTEGINFLTKQPVGRSGEFGFTLIT